MKNATNMNPIGTDNIYSYVESAKKSGYID